MTNFTSIVETVREKRIDDVDMPGKAGAPLLGECFQNAYELANELADQGYNPYIITGGLDFDREPAPNTAKEAYNRGQQHFWVYVDGTHVDISGEWLDASKEGTPMIRKEPPSHYVIYQKSQYSERKDSPEDYV